jgi:hypothetical protein
MLLARSYEEPFERPRSACWLKWRVPAAQHSSAGQSRKRTVVSSPDSGRFAGGSEAPTSGVRCADTAWVSCVPCSTPQACRGRHSGL